MTYCRFCCTTPILRLFFYWNRADMFRCGRHLIIPWQQQLFSEDTSVLWLCIKANHHWVFQLCFSHLFYFTDMLDISPGCVVKRILSAILPEAAFDVWQNNKEAGVRAAQILLFEEFLNFAAPYRHQHLHFLQQRRCSAAVNRSQKSSSGATCPGVNRPFPWLLWVGS